MADFASVGELEAFMATSSLGARGTAMLGYASAAIRAFCRQDLDVVTGRQEEFAGNFGRRILTLTETPVTAVSIVTVAAEVITDYIWTRWGQIYQEDYGIWDEGPIVVTYDSGYGSTEDQMIAIKSVCLEVAARALSGPDAGVFGPEIAELRGAAPGIFLTEGEKLMLGQHEMVGVG